MISPTALIAHAVPRLLEERGLRPHAPVGDEILFEGEVAGDPFWVMVTPLPHDAAGARRAMESLASRFKPAQPASRGLAMLVLLRTSGSDPDLSALAATPPREGTEPVLRAAVLDLSDGTVRADLGALRPMTKVADTLEKAAKAALAGEEPPDLRAIVQQQVNLSEAYRASRPWTTWAVVAAIVAIVLVQRYTGYVERLKLKELQTPASRWDLVLTDTLVYPVGKQLGVEVIWLILTVIGVLSLGSLLERLYGRAAWLAMWFAPSLGAALLAHGAGWGGGSSPVGAMFGLTGCTLAMGLLRRALPWPFRRGLLVSSAPMVIIFALMVWFSGMATASIAFAVLLGGVLAAFLPFRAPISADGGHVALRAVAWAIALASLCGVGLAATRAYLRTEKVPEATTHVSDEGWSITAPAGYQVTTTEQGLTLLDGAENDITIDSMPLAEAATLDEAVEAELAQFRAVGGRVRHEKLAIDGAPWWSVHVDLGDDSHEWFIGDVGRLRVRIESEGGRGAVQRGHAALRAVVGSFRLTR